MKGKNQVLFAIQDMLKIKLGETTPDKRFSLLETNCLGWCHKAPAMMVNNEVYTELTPEKVRDILTSYLTVNKQLIN
jgi:NADH:ubiquinone oxidoreductase subunit E